MKRLKLSSVLSHHATCSSFCFYQVIYLYSYIPPRFIKTHQSSPLLEIQLHFTFLLKKNSNSQYFSLQAYKRKCCCYCYSNCNDCLSFSLHSHILRKCSFQELMNKEIFVNKTRCASARWVLAKLQNIFKNHSLTFSFCEYRVIILASQQIYCTILFQSYGKSCIPLPSLFVSIVCNYSGPIILVFTTNFCCTILFQLYEKSLSRGK